MKETGFSRKKQNNRECGSNPSERSEGSEAKMVSAVSDLKKMIPASSDMQETEQRPALLLHSCCGPCSTSVIEQLAGEYVITVFFYNPCITDEDEYIRRRAAQKEFIRRYNEKHPSADPIRFIEGKYQPITFFKLVEGYENEPEGGDRCTLCFRQRLEKTAETAQIHGFDYFTTTLSVSPHKNQRKISETGRSIGQRYGVSFLDRDFKKKDGYKRSVEMSKAYGLYRQNYCGCSFSKRTAEPEEDKT